MNTVFISSILTHKLQHIISMSIATFKNHIAIRQFPNKSFRHILLSILVPFNQIPYLYLGISLPNKTCFLGNIIYHTYIFKMTPKHTKPIFNKYNNLFELRIISKYIVNIHVSSPFTIYSTILID